MGNDTQAQPEPVQENPVASMPNAEQNLPSESEVRPVAETTQEATYPEAPEELPAEVSARTAQQFEKLRSQLREERERRVAVEGAYRSLQPVQQPTYTPIIDPDTGFINENALMSVQQQAQQAQMEAQQARERLEKMQQDQENRETYQAHPELDPNGAQFDKKLHVATRQILLDAMVNPQDYGGRQLSFKEAADLAKGTVSAPIAAATAAKEALEQLTPKEQASLEATGSTSRASSLSGDEDEALRYASRRGDVDALAARLSKISR